MQANGRRGILSVLRVWSLSNGSLERLEEAIAAAGGMPWAIAVALWWLLPAGVAPVGLGGVPFACEVGRFACGSSACGACWATFSQRSGADVSRVWSVWNVWGGSGACWACWGTFCLRSWADVWRVWSVWSVVAPVGLVGVPFACEVGRFACGSVRSWADVWRVWSVWSLERL